MQHGRETREDVHDSRLYQCGRSRLQIQVVSVFVPGKHPRALECGCVFNYPSSDDDSVAFSSLDGGDEVVLEDVEAYAGWV